MSLRALRRRTTRLRAGAPASDGPAAAPDPAPPSTVVEAPPAAVTDLDDATGDDPFVAIERLRAANRVARDPEVDTRVVHLRHEAFARMAPAEPRNPWPPVTPDRFAGERGCPEVSAAELDADALAAAVTHHGCLLVRGLVPPATVTELRAAIDHAFRSCDTRARLGPDAPPDPWYRPFAPAEGYPEPKQGHRGWVRSAGGVLAADSPPAFETVIGAFERAGLREVVAGYLGERPVFSVDKCTLRRVPLDLGAAEWHQDGSFLGEGIRALNVWLALTPCGGDLPSPGLDLVPRRIDTIVPTGTPGAWFDWSVSPQVVDEVACDAPVIRPVFEAGDALLFDELFLHRTALEPTMTEERYAIESWFFAGSCYPGDAVPIVF